MLGLLVHKSVIGVMVSAAALLGALGLFGPAAEGQKNKLLCVWRLRQQEKLVPSMVSVEHIFVCMSK